MTESSATRVGVKLHLNNLNKDVDNPNFYGKVERYTLSVQNVLDGISNEIPHIDVGTIASVLNAYANVVLKSLESGNAVKFGELGVFYISSKGVVDSETGRTELTVKFTPSQLLKETVSNVSISSSEFVKEKGKIYSVTNVATGLSDATVKIANSCLVEGKSIKVGGADFGIWFAPVAKNGSLSTDEGTWIKVSTPLVYNMPSKLLFAVPVALTAETAYKIVVIKNYFYP